MVEPIKSEEVFGKATVGQGPAPKHTRPGHEACAYYWSEAAEDKQCEHGYVIVGGAFYSEDYVRELRIAGQRLLAEIDYDGPPMQRISTSEAIGKLRELVR